MKNRIKGIIIVRENTNTPPKMVKINGFILFLFKLFMTIIVLSAVILVLGWTVIVQRMVSYEEIMMKNDSLVQHSLRIDTLKLNLAKASRYLEYFKMVSSLDATSSSPSLPAINDYMKDTVSVLSTLIADAAREFSETPRIRPVTGIISKGYDKSILHEAVDFVAPMGSPIRATANGIVAKVYFSDDLGNVVVLKHSNGYETLYAHCREIIVKEGDNVVQGATIAFVGNSGNTKGIHLHYEVSKDGISINPEQLFL